MDKSASPAAHQPTRSNPRAHPPNAKFLQKVSAAGATVTTVSTGAHQASKEPDRVNVRIDPEAALGASFAVGGIVRQVHFYLHL